MDMLACLVLITVNLIQNIMLCKLIYDAALGIYPTLYMLCLIYSNYTDIWHVTPDIWLMSPALGIYTCTQYLTPISFMLYLKLMFAMLYVICDTWYWYLPYYIWHVIPDLDTCLATLITWPWTPILDMSYLTPAIDTRYMLYFHVVQIPGPDIMTLDQTLPPLIPDYMTYSWLSLLRGHDMIIILLLPDIWYSWTPVYLNPWNREAPDFTPDITLLLIPVIG